MQPIINPTTVLKNDTHLFEYACASLQNLFPRLMPPLFSFLTLLQFAGISLLFSSLSGFLSSTLSYLYICLRVHHLRILVLISFIKAFPDEHQWRHVTSTDHIILNASGTEPSYFSFKLIATRNMRNTIYRRRKSPATVIGYLG